MELDAIDEIESLLYNLIGRCERLERACINEAITYKTKKEHDKEIAEYKNRAEKLISNLKKSGTARQRARQIAGELADILTDEMFGDYGTDWSWDELCEFINLLKTLAKARGEPVSFEPEMKEHIEQYHNKPDEAGRVRCRICKKFKKQNKQEKGNKADILTPICSNCLMVILRLRNETNPDT